MRDEWNKFAQGYGGGKCYFKSDLERAGNVGVHEESNVGLGDVSYLLCTPGLHGADRVADEPRRCFAL